MMLVVIVIRMYSHSYHIIIIVDTFCYFTFSIPCITKIPRPVTKHALSEEWIPVTVIEIKKFLGLIFVTGIVREPKLEL